MRALLLLPLVLAANPTRLVLSDDNAVQLYVGNPAQPMHFHLNHTLSTIELHVLPTSATYTLNGLEGRELFYFGSQALLLSFVYNPTPNNEIFNFHKPVHGTIGLGKSSELWLHWDNASLNSAYLLLGDYDRYAQSDYTLEPPALTDSAYCLAPNGAYYRLHIDAGHIETYLPVELLAHMPDHLLLEQDICGYQTQLGGVESCGSETLYLDYNPELTVTGLPYNSYEAIDGETLILGKHVMDTQAWFFNRLTGTEFFAQSVFAHTEPTANGVFVLMLIVSTVAWVLIAVVNTFKSRWTRNLFIEIEIFSYTAALLAFLTNVVGAHQSQLLANYIGMNPLLFIIFVAYSILIGIAISAYTLLPIFQRRAAFAAERFRHSVAQLNDYKNLRIMYFTSALFSSLWLCTLHRHTLTMDLIILAGYASSVAFSSTLVLCSVYIHSGVWLSIAVVHTMLTYAFLAATIVPVFDMAGIQGHPAPFTVAYLCVLWTIAVIVYSYYHINKKNPPKES